MTTESEFHCQLAKSFLKSYYVRLSDLVLRMDLSVLEFQKNYLQIYFFEKFIKNC